MDGYGLESTETRQFAFEHLRAGRYRVAIVADADGRRATHELTLGEDDINQNVVLMLDAGRRIRGTLSASARSISIEFRM